MLSVYNYSNITQATYKTTGHTVKNINAKINVGVINPAGTTVTVMISFDNGITWASSIILDISSVNNTDVGSLYFSPGITNVSLFPAVGVATMQVIEYYEPRTQ